MKVAAAGAICAAVPGRADADRIVPDPFTPGLARMVADAVMAAARRRASPKRRHALDHRGPTIGSGPLAALAPHHRGGGRGLSARADRGGDLAGGGPDRCARSREPFRTARLDRRPGTGGPTVTPTAAIGIPLWSNTAAATDAAPAAIRPSSTAQPAAGWPARSRRSAGSVAGPRPVRSTNAVRVREQRAHLPGRQVGQDRQPRRGQRGRQPHPDLGDQGRGAPGLLLGQVQRLLRRAGRPGAPFRRWRRSAGSAPAGPTRSSGCPRRYALPISNAASPSPHRRSSARCTANPAAASSVSSS